jgi:hypothetical protein
MKAMTISKAAGAAGVGVETVRYNEHAISEARLREVIENGAFEVEGRS